MALSSNQRATKINQFENLPEPVTSIQSITLTFPSLVWRSPNAPGSTPETFFRQFTLILGEILKFLEYLKKKLNQKL